RTAGEPQSVIARRAAPTRSAYPAPIRTRRGESAARAATAAHLGFRDRPDRGGDRQQDDPALPNRGAHPAGIPPGQRASDYGGGQGRTAAGGARDARQRRAAG